MNKLQNVNATCIKVENGVRITVTAEVDSADRCHYYKLVVVDHKTTIKGREVHAVNDGVVTLESISWTSSFKECPRTIDQVSVEKDGEVVDTPSDVPVEEN